MKNKAKASVCQLFGYYNYGGITRVIDDLTSRCKNYFQFTMLCLKSTRLPEKG